MLAPPLVGGIMYYFGWRRPSSSPAPSAFFAHPVADPGAPPRRASLHHARELAYIRAGQPSTTPPPLEQSDAGVWREALRTRELWALMAARLLSDPVWLFFSFWIPKFFKSEHGFDLKSISLFVWLPFLAADVGSIAGGWLSSFFVGRGWPVLRARKLALCCSASLNAGHHPVGPRGQLEAGDPGHQRGAFATRAGRPVRSPCLPTSFPRGWWRSATALPPWPACWAARHRVLRGKPDRERGLHAGVYVAGCMHPVGALMVLLFVKSAWSAEGVRPPRASLAPAAVVEK